MDLASLFRSSPDVLDLDAGKMIFEQGESGGGKMYVVLSGTVEIRLGDQVLESIEAGGFFGEMGLIDDAPRSASAVAQAPSRLAVVDEKQFLFMVQQTPFFSLHVMRVLVVRLRNLNRRLR